MKQSQNDPKLTGLCVPQSDESIIEDNDGKDGRTRHHALGTRAVIWPVKNTRMRMRECVFRDGIWLLCCPFPSYPLKMTLF